MLFFTLEQIYFFGRESTKGFVFFNGTNGIFSIQDVSLD